MYYSDYSCVQPSAAILDFGNYCRMTKEQFEDLLQLIAPLIVKEDAIRTPISPKERLLLTLRYLASGDSQVSMSYEFGVGTSTVSQIISETCTALWVQLAPLVLPTPNSEDWKNSEKNFRCKWNFPNCVGAIDGKHVVIQAPQHSGSTYYNYKGSHSLVLLAICDANYKFLVVDIGAEGRQSDGGVFRNSSIGQALINGEADFPPDKQIYDDGPALPHVLVGDEAFPLTTYLMRPYPGRNGLSIDQRIFNYRLSRARRMIESTFGILVSQWRIFRKPIIANVENVHKIIEACVCLHNFIRNMDVDDENLEFECNDNYNTMNSSDHGSGGMRNIGRLGSNTYSRDAVRVRDEFMMYFKEDGAVNWQTSSI
ncbi:PREDICTED: putative nuclease HARBI1 [Cyphomyrmex costatus]|uniref:putative nuclease HARBI1 n=1 Tax=Cyphomyrmex costatus TaxID=456900 RepID=UPI0008524448|nr:PREDICTED: putative nuclease HARBI1 [Cyphomyrmex costatus]